MDHVSALYNLILVSRQGFGEHKTEQLCGHSQNSNVTDKLRLMMMMMMM